ncbi:MAG: aminotransferase class I/II-fold pyridoxal phosphate-dependent enzyme [Candidatus Aminicenantes bacterium]|nr:aminotransferase class I/II-fold pyridoxal phosphate-dependent enzyme [Candidatus Aminicenantes bacterium]
MNPISDFRSDTVTKPTSEMRRAMAEAEVGDDVLGDDLTVQKLESLAADTLGKKAALYVPSGTMGNSIAIKAWTRELDEVIIEARSHIYNMESTHMTFISRVSPRVLTSHRGAMDPGEVENNIKKPSVHLPRTSLICIENTHNNWGGAVIPLENMRSIKAIAEKHGIHVHLDGARLFNASVASGVPVKEYARMSDSVMFCLSKGLSAPIGSILAGPQDFIDLGRRIRKALGGGMRQVGVIAAPGILALQNMVSRLKEDHMRAKKLALAIHKMPGIQLNPEFVETDIIIFGFEHSDLAVPDLLNRLKQKGILALSVPQGVRMVTNRGIDDNDIERTINAFNNILHS